MRIAAILTILPLSCMLGAAPGAVKAVDQGGERPPSIVIIVADDLGYGDLGCYGHPTIRTPHLDRMAREGQRWTSFYAGACVCTPSRTAMLTGRLPIRSGMTSRERRVMFPDSAGGLPPSEITIAQALKSIGYDTACIGKWHLGHLPEYLPTRRGFDSFLGTPYSNDEARTAIAPKGEAIFRDSKVEYWDIPLLRNEAVVDQPVDQRTLTRRYTEEAVRFITSRRPDAPYFLYVAHNMPHVPLFRSEEFAGRSARGLYGDVVEELDWSVGRILDAIRQGDRSTRTVVFFTSDNGPWLPFRQQGGSAGLLRDGKGTTWEGGMRVPMVAWWPGTIPAGSTVMDMACNLDLFTTSLSLAGVGIPGDRAIDGLDIRPALLGKGPSPREVMFFYRDDELYAVRQGPYKAHFLTAASDDRSVKAVAHEPPLLFHLGHDPSEQFDVAARHPEVIARIRETTAAFLKTVAPAENQMIRRIGSR